MIHLFTSTYRHNSCTASRWRERKKLLFCIPWRDDGWHCRQWIFGIWYVRVLFFLSHSSSVPCSAFPLALGKESKWTNTNKNTDWLQQWFFFPFPMRLYRYVVVYFVLQALTRMRCMAQNWIQYAAFTTREKWPYWMLNRRHWKFCAHPNSHLMSCLLQRLHWTTLPMWVFGGAGGRAGERTAAANQSQAQSHFSALHFAVGLQTFPILPVLIFFAGLLLLLLVAKQIKWPTPFFFFGFYFSVF